MAGNGTNGTKQKRPYTVALATQASERGAKRFRVLSRRLRNNPDFAALADSCEQASVLAASVAATLKGADATKTLRAKRPQADKVVFAQHATVQIAESARAKYGPLMPGVDLTGTFTFHAYNGEGPQKRAVLLTPNGTPVVVAPSHVAAAS